MFPQLYLESHKRSHRNAVTTASNKRKGVSTRSKSLVWWRTQCKNNQGSPAVRGRLHVVPVHLSSHSLSCFSLFLIAFSPPSFSIQNPKRNSTLWARLRKCLCCCCKGCVFVCVENLSCNEPLSSHSTLLLCLSLTRGILHLCPTVPPFSLHHFLVITSSFPPSPVSVCILLFLCLPLS